MEFLSGWTIDNYLTLLLTIVMAIGSIFALAQWNSSIKIRRTEFLNEIINKIWFDQSMAKTVNLIDNKPDWYTEDFHKSYSDFSYQMDRILSYFDFICYLYSKKNLSFNEFNVIKYEIDRTCASPSVQAYIWNLYHFSNKMEAGCTFMYLINYGIKEKIISDDLLTNNTDLYKKYLNF